MSKYTKSAKGQACQVRIPGVCNWDNSTVVFSHINGAGIGKKAEDIHGAYCCSSCHDVLDGRVKSEYARYFLKLWHFEGMVRTQEIMIKEGILKL